jgi:hypothetical protein
MVYNNCSLRFDPSGKLLELLAQVYCKRSKVKKIGFVELK